MTPLFDPYAVLGVTGQASQEEINSAYRRLVRQHHPDTRACDAPMDSSDTSDTSDTSAVVLERVLAAYALLRDPARRAEYDRLHPARAPADHPRPVAAPVHMPPGMMRMTLTIRVRPLRNPGAAA